MVEGKAELAKRVCSAVGAVLMCTALPGCGDSEEDDGVTYGDEVQPIFRRSCVVCHHRTSPIGVDIQNPFDATPRGLVNSPNSWKVDHPEEDLPERNVVPGDPENSFLIDKLTGNLPVNGNGGASMPLQVSRVTDEELAILEQWVRDGAQNDTFFEQNVRPIFGTEESPASYYGGKCIFCHYSGSPNPLDLSDPFGDNGLVNVEATYRARMMRVLPGDPEQSLMILKVRATESSSDYGAPMPFSYDKLSSAQVDVVRQWILEGARP